MTETITWEEKVEIAKLLNNYDENKKEFWKKTIELLPRFDAQMFDMWITGICLTEYDNYPEYFQKVHESYSKLSEKLEFRSEFRYGMVEELIKNP
jgi:hypothetical protein